jgi:hypothetical protein
VREAYRNLAHLVAFDVLQVDGGELLAAPLVERRAAAGWWSPRLGGPTGPTPAHGLARQVDGRRGLPRAEMARRVDRTWGW